MDLKEFLNFRKMITPVIIKFIFWISVAASVLFGIITVFGGLISGFNNGSFWGTIATLIITPIVVIFSIFISRIYTELLIVIFQINENLTDIRNFLEEKQ